MFWVVVSMGLANDLLGNRKSCNVLHRTTVDDINPALPIIRDILTVVPIG